MKRELPKANEVWRHFKNKLYLIVSIATHSETREPYVVYKALYDDYADYIRPLDMFMSETDKVKYPQAEQRGCYGPVPTCGQEVVYAFTIF